MFATEFIRTGAIILTESPFLAIPTDRTPTETLHEALARTVLQLLSDNIANADNEIFKEALRVLHPVSLVDISTDALQDARVTMKETVATLRQGASVGRSTMISDDDVLRILLAMQFNAFGSGLYCQLSMINHGKHPR